MEEIVIFLINQVINNCYIIKKYHSINKLVFIAKGSDLPFFTRGRGYNYTRPHRYLLPFICRSCGGLSANGEEKMYQMIIVNSVMCTRGSLTKLLWNPLKCATFQHIYKSSECTRCLLRGFSSCMISQHQSPEKRNSHYNEKKYRKEDNNEVTSES